MFAFKFEKALQAAAFLLRREQSREMNYMRLLKLLYIADREGVKRTGRPITGDSVAAMDRGPVLSDVLDLIRGIHLRAPEWAHFIQRDEYEVRLVQEPGVGSLSRFEIELLEEVAERYRAFDEWDMVNETHKFPEWQKNTPGKKSMKWISLRDIVAAVGRTGDLADIEADAKADQAFNRVFGV